VKQTEDYKKIIRMMTEKFRSDIRKIAQSSLFAHKRSVGLLPFTAPSLITLGPIVNNSLLTQPTQFDIYQAYHIDGKRTLTGISLESIDASIQVKITHDMKLELLDFIRGVSLSNGHVDIPKTILHPSLGTITNELNHAAEITIRFDKMQQDPTTSSDNVTVEQNLTKCYPTSSNIT